jgi:integrase
MSIYRDPSGRCWVFDFDRRVAGQRLRSRRRLPESWTRAQAQAFDRRESARLYAVATGDRAPATIDQAVARYLLERVPALKSGRGIAHELDIMAPYYEGKPLDKLAEACASYTADHRATLAPATIRNRLRYLTAAARWGWKHHGMGGTDPGARVVMPAVRNERQVYIDRRQMLTLARACNHWQARAAIRIAFYSGMRIGEIRAAEIDGDEFVLADSKNGDSARIPIHPRIRCCIGYEWPAYETIRYHFNKAREKVGMEHVRFHDTRHSTASELLDQGVDLYVIGAVLRHKSVASTKRYSHLKTARMREAIGKIGRKLG